MGILTAVMAPHPPLIIPAVGKGEEKKIKDTIENYGKAMEQLLSCDPETVVILTPHSVMYADYFHISPGVGATGDFGQFGAPSARYVVEYDAAFAEFLGQMCAFEGISGGTQGERDKHLDHGTMIPVHFLREAAEKLGKQMPKMIRMGLSGLSLREHYRLGMLLRDSAEQMNRRIAIVASGDLSHKLLPEGPYGFAPEGPKYDARIMEVMENGDFEELLEFDPVFCDKAAECGHRGFTILAGAFDGRSVKGQRLSYEGPFGVGYGICTFVPGEPDAARRFLDQFEAKQAKKLEERKEKEDAYVRLARLALESFVTTGGRIIDAPGGLPQEITGRRAGAFVSLHKDGQLRGCIGTIGPTKYSLAEEIIHNAVSAAAYDNRFPPVRQEELADIVYSVDVLGEPQDIASPSELDPARYGVIVSAGNRRGLLLPDLEGVDTAEEQIAIARRKANIPEREKHIKLQRFEVVRHY